MNDTLTLATLFNRGNLKALAAPGLIIVILSMMVLPLPSFVLDLFFTFNIAMAVMVLMVAMYTRRPLDFSVFPTVLLITTLLRLSLNVASTRIVLINGHTGPDAAGKVIEAFGHFLVGGNYTVGIVVFVILTIINFVVITKGAGRIAEVSARFTLDAMPGKQMAIDADLNAGLIGEDEARTRRRDVAQEADLYGVMDGASMFVRGDAIAGILILVINILGGLVVGILQHDLEAGQAAKIYTLLTIGDGLVAQIPALIISTAAGLVVTRVGDAGGNIGEQVIGQVFGNPIVMVLTAGILGVLGLIPGMPHVVFLLLAAGIGALAWSMMRRGEAERQRAAEVTPPPPPPQEGLEASWADVAPVDVLGLEVGYRLIPLVDRNQDGDLLKRIRGLRKKFAAEVGFLSAPVHIRDNLELNPNAYRITLKGVEVGGGEAYPALCLAINPGRVSGPLNGKQTKDPAFGLPATWVETALRDQASAMGYTAGVITLGIDIGRGRCGNGDRHPYQPCHALACIGTAGAAGSPATARPYRQGRAQAGRRPGAQATAAVHRAAGIAEPARRRRQHSRHAHHHRTIGGTLGAHAGCPRPDQSGAHRPRPRHCPAALSGWRRNAGHGARARTRAHPGSGGARRWRRCLGH